MTDKAKDAAYWARLHITSDRAKPVELPSIRRHVAVFSFCAKQRRLQREGDT